MVAGAILPLRGFPWGTLPVLIAALGAGWFLLGMEGRRAGALGFHGARAAGWEILAGLALGAGIALIAVTAIALAGGVRWSVAPWESIAIGSAVSAAVAALWLFTLPAFAEEALFRGYAFQALAESWGIVTALLLTSAAFALLHLANPNASALGMMNIFAAGVFLGAVYLRSASLWWASGAHLGWNWAHGFLVGVPVSGLELVDNPLIEATQHGPDWISGGDFGPEGSALSFLVLLGASAWTWRTRKIRPEQFGDGALREPPLWAARMRPADRRGSKMAGDIQTTEREQDTR